jgi:hypothetical protein
MEYLDIPSSLEIEMKKKWYSCDGSDKSFWNHELQKHGSCIKDYIICDLDSTKYFNDTLKMYDGMDSVINYICGNISDQCLISLYR